MYAEYEIDSITNGVHAATRTSASFQRLNERYIPGCTENAVSRSNDALSLYGKLEHTIVPIFYRDRDRYVEVMRNAIALNRSFFNTHNTHRMIQECVLKAYFR
jgi:glucan phosphorylase